MKKVIQWIVALIAAAALAAAAILLAWYKGMFLPDWIIWNEKTQICEVYETSSGQFELSLKNKRFKISQNENQNQSNEDCDDVNNVNDKNNKKNNQKDREKNNKKTIWTSPKNILVQDFLWCDINHDEKDELLLLCWRIGRYGNAKPYWVEKDEHSWSQHIYIYELRDNEEIHPLWMASDIGMDVESWSFDEKERLVINETSGRKTAWDWVSWGLSLWKTYD